MHLRQRRQGGGRLRFRVHRVHRMRMNGYESRSSSQVQSWDVKQNIKSKIQGQILGNKGQNAKNQIHSVCQRDQHGNACYDQHEIELEREKEKRRFP